VSESHGVCDYVLWGDGVMNRRDDSQEWGQGLCAGVHITGLLWNADAEFSK